MNTATCEHQQLDMTCGRDEAIIVINVTYGRTVDSTCSRGDTSKRCRAELATKILRERCWGSKVKASNSLFGNPCVGTFKYLIVAYKCYSEYHN